MPGPGPRRLTPLSGIGIRYITAGGRRYKSAPKPQSSGIGRPSIVWASCVIQPLKPTPPYVPKMVLAQPAGGFYILVEAAFTNFNDPCK